MNEFPISTGLIEKDSEGIQKTDGSDTNKMVTLRLGGPTRGNRRVTLSGS